MKTLFEYQNILGYNRILDWRDDFHNYKTVLARRIDFFIIQSIIFTSRFNI